MTGYLIMASPYFRKSGILLAFEDMCVVTCRHILEIDVWVDGEAGGVSSTRCIDSVQSLKASSSTIWLWDLTLGRMTRQANNTLSTCFCPCLVYLYLILWCSAMQSACSTNCKLPMSALLVEEVSSGIINIMVHWNIYMDVAPNYYVSQFFGRSIYMLLTLERAYVRYICTHINT
jgi:hypothetical protein